MKKQRRKAAFAVVTAGCLLAALLSLCLGSSQLSLPELWSAVAGRFAGEESLLDPAGRIFWYVRLPRTCACLLAGAGLAVSGAVIQSVLANKLASPGIIGVNAGAGLAVTICCACGIMTGWVIAGAAFGGALVAVLFVTCTAERVGASRTTVILGGVAVNSILNAISEAITTLVPEVAVHSLDFRVGGFASVSPVRLVPAAVLILLGVALLFTLCNDLDVIALGEETAQGLGMRVRRMRTVFLTLAALLAGASVSFAGLLGFVGLIVPHLARRIVGSESRWLLPFCALFGAGLVTGCDLAARLLFDPYEVPVGILLSLIGGPFFLLLLLKQRGGHRHV